MVLPSHLPPHPYAPTLGELWLEFIVFLLPLVNPVKIVCHSLGCFCPLVSQELLKNSFSVDGGFGARRPKKQNTPT